jgi:hypothetical protein
MKRIKVMIVALFAIVLSVSAADRSLEQRIEKAKVNLTQALHSENEGVRNGSLLVLAKIKSDFPQLDLSDLNKTLISISADDNAAYIRANANLTYIYLNSAELPNLVKVESTENPAVFFNKLYQELNKEFLALR